MMILFLVAVLRGALQQLFVRGFVWGVFDSPLVVRKIHRMGRSVRSRKKPDWVMRELIRMKAFGPNLGCRKLAEAFNRRFEESRHMRVSKSFVAAILKKHRYAVIKLRKHIRARGPRPVVRNVVWGLDLTFVTDASKTHRTILGIVDHGTRACLALQQLDSRRSLVIFHAIIQTIRKFGLPNKIRVDNEPTLKSRLMKFGLNLIGVSLQVIEPHSPWQNGRIERMFGTFKQAIGQIAVLGQDDLRCRLMEFRCFYNHVRSHQNLDGCTPAEVWSGIGKQVGDGQLVSAWVGILSGWYFDSG